VRQVCVSRPFLVCHPAGNRIRVSLRKALPWAFRQDSQDPVSASVRDAAGCPDVLVVDQLIQANDLCIDIAQQILDKSCTMVIMKPPADERDVYQISGRLENYPLN
jgi:hypothetical protein